jgi:REP element-mobilizing transposase RayT
MSQVPVVPGVIYHIYNRGNNGENIFLEERNYHYFMKLYTKYIAPVAETYAYCLLRNHFHLMVRIKTLEEINREERGCLEQPRSLERFISQQFATFFGTYTKAINKATSRTGTLFEGRFKRKPVTKDRYFKMLVAYIHQNPQKHGLIADYRDWPFSSYHAMISQKPTQLSREATLSCFNGSDGLIQYHETIADFKEITDLIDYE